MSFGLCFSVACKRRAPISETPPETPAAPQAGQEPAGAEETPAAAPPTAQAPQLPANDKSRYLFVDAGTINGDVNGPRSEAIRAILDSANTALADCAKNVPKPKVDTKVVVKYVIEYSGKISADPSGEIDPSGLACMKSTVEALKVPPFSGQAIPGQIFVLVPAIQIAAPVARDAGAAPTK